MKRVQTGTAPDRIEEKNDVKWLITLLRPKYHKISFLIFSDARMKISIYGFIE